MTKTQFYPPLKPGPTRRRRENLYGCPMKKTKLSKQMRKFAGLAQPLPSFVENMAARHQMSTDNPSLTFECTVTG